MSITTAASGKHRSTHLAATDFDAARRLAGITAKQPKDDPRQVALERAESFEAALSGGLLALQKSAGTRVAASLDDRDLVQRGVELAVSVPTQAMASLLPGGRVERGDSPPNGRTVRRSESGRRRRSRR